MLAHVIIAERGEPAAPSRELGPLQAEFPAVGFHLGDAALACPAICLEVAEFWSADFDAYRVDRACEELAVQGPFALRLEGHGASATASAALTRYQRFVARRNLASAGPVFDRVLARHRELHDCQKPLVRADFDHALDTWQWMLRLEPSASRAVQIAALFHDIERLASEADVRIEQHASDYRAFKDEHARRGGAMTRTALTGTGLDQATIERAAELVADHERPGRDPERLLLNEADALSFFSLNSTGFHAYYGAEHTRRKIAYTLARLRDGVKWRLAQIRFHPVVAGMLREAGISLDRDVHQEPAERRATESTRAADPAGTGGAR